MLNKSNTAALK